jgi:hypothetical protein
MNIVDAILEKNKKYIIFISGLLWWDEFNSIVDALKTNLKFEVIYINQLIPENKLITSSDHINFTAANEIIKEKLDKDKETKTYRGYIVVSYSFPPERIDIYSDIHVSIQPNSLLQTSLIIDIIKKKNIPRMEVDMHIAYLVKSWKSNRISKTIIVQPDYVENINKYYNFMFDAIIENINKKLYGEKAENMGIEEQTNELKEKYPLPPDPQPIQNISDPVKLSSREKGIINNGIELSNFVTDLDDAAFNKIDSEDNNNDAELEADVKNNTLTFDENLNLINKEISEEADEDDEEEEEEEKDITGGYKNKSKVMKRSMPYYIGRRKINQKN